MRHRLLHRIYARLSGYFWLPCPSCGQEFGGHELHDVNGHQSSIPKGDDLHLGVGICPDCTAAGVGCRAWAEIRHWWHYGCEFVR